MRNSLRSSLVAFICALLFIFTASASSIPQPTLSPDAAKYDAEHPEFLEPDQLYAASAILMTQDTGEVIFEKEANSIRYPASTTKILTVLLGITLVDDLNQIVTVSETALNIPGDSSVMGLKAGEEIPFIDVLYGTMMLSGNDGANVIAEVVSGNIYDFVQLMNRAAEAYGCQNTHFANAHGYHDDNHYSTAYDLALIAREAMKNKTFREIASCTSYTIAKTNMQRTRTITTKSEYMLKGTDEKPNKYYYQFANGIKTGSHSMAGYCFVGSAEKDDVQLISVVLFTGENARWADTIKLMNYGFSQYMSLTPAEIYAMNPITIETSGYSTADTNRGRIQLVCRNSGTSEVRITATRNEIERIADNIRDYMLIQYTRDFSAPFTVGETVGTLTYFPPNQEPVSYDLTASRSVAARENAPRTLAQIVADTENDPNPLPPFSFEIALNLFGPLLLIFLLIVVLRRLHRNHKSKKPRTPRTVNRYLK